MRRSPTLLFVYHISVTYLFQIEFGDLLHLNGTGSINVKSLRPGGVAKESQNKESKVVKY